MKLYPDISELSALFDEELSRLGGTVIDRFAQGDRLYLRGLLPRGGCVQPRDFIGHGLAVRTREMQVVVHPYTFRQVCSNGAIHVTNVRSRIVERSESAWRAADTAGQLREAIRACAEPGVFDANLSEMQEMLSQEVRMPLMMSSFLSRIGDQKLVMGILDHFLDQRDRSVFGLMNAVTSIARDEEEPERRWRLEELGGGILAALKPPVPVLDSGERRDLPKPQTEEALEGCASRRLSGLAAD